MSYQGYDCIEIAVADGVATVVIDHPPINLFDARLMVEMDRLRTEIAEDDAVRVVVFRSANPDFFIAHADVDLIRKLPLDAAEKPTELSFFYVLVEGFRTLPKVSIGQIEGRARGGGSEFLASLDMRFAAEGRAILAQPEVALGIIPGGGGTQRLPRLMGRGRALEAILGARDFDAHEAERYGWVNRALPADEIGPFVEGLARRIASLPAEAVALAKEAVSAAEPSPVPGLLTEAHCFQRSLATQAAMERMAQFLEIGGQTVECELRIQDLIDSMAAPPAPDPKLV